MRVSELVAAIDRNEPSEQVQERLRYWGDFGLLATVGTRTPGTGKHISYSTAAIREAEILHVLHDLGIPITSNLALCARIMHDKKLERAARLLLHEIKKGAA